MAKKTTSKATDRRLTGEKLFELRQDIVETDLALLYGIEYSDDRFLFVAASDELISETLANYSKANEVERAMMFSRFVHRIDFLEREIVKNMEIDTREMLDREQLSAMRRAAE